MRNAGLSFAPLAELAVNEFFLFAFPECVENEKKPAKVRNICRFCCYIGHVIQHYVSPAKPLFY